MSEEWGPWIDGTIAPAKGAVIQMDLRDKAGSNHLTHEARVICVDHKGDVFVDPMPPLTGFYELDRYRVRRPRALLQLIEMVENLPAPVQPRVDA